MRKEFILGTVVGGLICGSIGVFAGQYVANDNPFPIQLNGKNVNIEGYNINDSTYFKLRDIANVVGGFTVDFQNDEIIISKYDSYTCYPKSNVPDFSALYNVTSIDDCAIDSCCKYYNAPCIDHQYSYDPASMYDYIRLLESIGFECLATYYSDGSCYLYGKDNNYVVVSCDSDLGNCVSVYPINDPDYQPIINPNLLVQKIDAYRDSVIKTWRNEMNILNLSADNSAYFTLAPVQSKGFYEIYGTHITYYYESLNGVNGYFKFEYLPETNQIMFVDDSSIYNVSKF